MNHRKGRETHSRPSLLLHICCAPCATHVIELLRRKFRIRAFFYNPNIQPQQEHDRRLREGQDLCRQMGVDLIAGEYDAVSWSRRLRGRADDHEGGAHCSVCFWIRLVGTAARARKEGFDRFATTLTVSPHKDAGAVNRMGEKAARWMRTGFYPADFKKDHGFKKSCQLSRTYGLYRQDYCGCVYSLRERIARRAR